MNNLCRVCRETKPDQILNQLRCIQSLLRNVEPTSNHRYRFNWNYNFKCKYSLPCNKFSSTERNIKNIINDIEDKLVTIAKDEDGKIYHNVLSLIRGYFPSVYTELEKIHFKNKD